MNVFIIGINQIEDVEIDRLNKPWLPIAAGDLSLEAARRIVAVAAIVPHGDGDHAGRRRDGRRRRRARHRLRLLVPAAAAQALPAVAAGSITLVRSLVVNLGVWLHIAGTPVTRASGR